VENTVASDQRLSESALSPTNRELGRANGCPVGRRLVPFGDPVLDGHVEPWKDRALQSNELLVLLTPYYIVAVPDVVVGDELVHQRQVALAEPLLCRSLSRRITCHNV